MAFSDRIKRKEDAFYGILKSYARDILACAETFSIVVNEWPKSASRIPEVKKCEEACDEHLRNSLQQLAESFITPFDREDINELVHRMDEVPDFMEDIAARFELFHVGEMRPEAVRCTEITLTAVREMVALFDALPEYRTSKAAQERVIEIKRLEDEGDVVYRGALADLFDSSTGSDPIEVIKWKSLLDELEDVLDAVCDVANVIQGVLMKNA